MESRLSTAPPHGPPGSPSFAPSRYVLRRVVVQFEMQTMQQKSSCSFANFWNVGCWNGSKTRTWSCAPRAIPRTPRRRHPPGRAPVCYYLCCCCFWHCYVYLSLAIFCLFCLFFVLAPPPRPRGGSRRPRAASLFILSNDLNFALRMSHLIYT